MIRLFGKPAFHLALALVVISIIWAARIYIGSETVSSGESLWAMAVRSWIVIIPTLALAGAMLLVAPFLSRIPNDDPDAVESNVARGFIGLIRRLLATILAIGFFALASLLIINNFALSYLGMADLSEAMNTVMITGFFGDIWLETVIAVICLLLAISNKFDLRGNIGPLGVMLLAIPVGAGGLTVYRLQAQGAYELMAPVLEDDGDVSEADMRVMAEAQERMADAAGGMSDGLSQHARALEQIDELTADATTPEMREELAIYRRQIELAATQAEAAALLANASAAAQRALLASSERQRLIQSDTTSIGGGDHNSPARQPENQTRIRPDEISVFRGQPYSDLRRQLVSGGWQIDPRDPGGAPGAPARGADQILSDFDDLFHCWGTGVSICSILWVDGTGNFLRASVQENESALYDYGLGEFPEVRLRNFLGENPNGEQLASAVLAASSGQTLRDARQTMFNAGWRNGRSTEYARRNAAAARSEYEEQMSSGNWSDHHFPDIGDPLYSPELISCWVTRFPSCQYVFIDDYGNIVILDAWGEGAVDQVIVNQYSIIDR